MRDRSNNPSQYEWMLYLGATSPQTEIQTYTHVHTYIHIYITYIPYTHTCMHINIHIYIHIHTYIQTHAHTYIYTYIHTYTCIHTYTHVSVAEWLAWLTSNCGRIGAIGSSPSSGLKPNLWGQKGFNPLCQCIYVYVCIVKPDIQNIHRCSDISTHTDTYTNTHTTFASGNV